MKKSKKLKNEKKDLPPTLGENNNLFGIVIRDETIEDTKSESMDIFGVVLPSINNKTGHLMDAGLLQNNEYNAFLVNKAFSFGGDSLLYSNEMNKRHEADVKIQYDFYYYGLDKAKRFNKWIKEEPIEDIDIIKEYYGCSFIKAREYLNILSEEQLESIKKKLDKGGISK